MAELWSEGCQDLTPGFAIKLGDDNDLWAAMSKIHAINCQIQNIRENTDQLTRPFANPEREVSLAQYREAVAEKARRIQQVRDNNTKIYELEKMRSSLFVAITSYLPGLRDYDNNMRIVIGGLKMRAFWRNGETFLEVAPE